MQTVRDSAPKELWVGRERVTRSSEQGIGGTFRNRRQPSAVRGWQARGSFQWEELESLLEPLRIPMGRDGGISIHHREMNTTHLA